MRLIFAPVLMLAACGTALPPDEASVVSGRSNGGMTVSGTAGSNFSESDIRELIVNGTCSQAGMRVVSVEVEEPSASGRDFTARCEP